MTVKITVSLPDELVEDARAAVEARQATSVSGYVAMAMRTFANRDSWEQYMADMDELHGPIPAEAYEWADKVLGITPGEVDGSDD